MRRTGLGALLAEVLDDSALNERDLLLARARELNASSATDLQKALDRIGKAQDEQDRERMQKFYV